MTVEPTPTLSAEDAYRLTQRIRTAASGAREAMETLSVLVEEARAGGAHAAMGFASWTDYLSSTLGASPMRLDRARKPRNKRAIPQRHQARGTAQPNKEDIHVQSYRH